MSEEFTISDELGNWLVAEYSAALEAYKASNSLVRDGSKNFYAACEVLKAGGLQPNQFHRTAFLSALAQLAANGTLDRERSDEEKRILFEKKVRVNEAKDRYDGNIHTHRGHALAADSKPIDPEDVKAEVQQLIKAATQYREAEQSISQEQAPTAGDALVALQAILDPVSVSGATRETQRQIERWIRTSDTKHYRSVRQTHPDLATKMDRVMSRNIIED